ncbi:hypothetical protein A1O3_00626 [Capronia epimyces CBS 606.96]|uniref:CorA-like transporter domain-containing protein n=1 Tax=Capronia epimyces CBS 606.96 TaxID=1182542 RepID=W9YS36_9EURO|nr:uncharacterized protein A1O3_00626 [Capronia epimyces CBS 606.96]EXJ92076.1 hypothetical protein A1O3_00626 [Capronia epimyces CBS 606.96]
MSALLPLFIDSCRRAHEFPNNLIDHGSTPSSVRREYQQRLRARAPSLFCSQQCARVELFRHDATRGSFTSEISTNVHHLRQLLPGSLGQIQSDRKCSFVFVGADSSRDPLHISPDMAFWIISFFQVLPPFLEFLFAFGMQLRAVDFQFSGFREDNRIEASLNRGRLPELGRSGKDFQICYNLKTFEYKAGIAWPWSSRQTVIWHSFDVENGHASWMAIKANDIIRDRLKEVSDMSLSQDKDIYTSIPKMFVNTLTCHTAVIEWSGEGWRRYISFLEEQLQSLKRRAVVDRVTRVAAPVPCAESPPSTGIPMANLAPNRTWTLLSAATDASTANVHATVPTGPQQPQEPLPESIAIDIPEELQEPANLPPDFDPKHQGAELEEDQTVYRIEELQDAQAFEGMVNETCLVLKSNFPVLAQIEAFFRDLPESTDLEPALRNCMRANMPRFLKRIQAVRSDLQMHLDRIETISKAITECKNLLYGIVEYQSMQANKMFAAEARCSALRMEQMTKEMKALTLKTTLETVLMRIITVVTVFFLPATFVSTLMSTDIVNFKTTDSNINSGSTSLGAVKLFLCLSFSLMVATFSSGFGLYWWASRYSDNA